MRTSVLAGVLAGLLLSFFGVQPALGDEDRPKIGLALSGGGAKGCAHVGVLQVLEELRVPVDYMAGTSMGAVVGGLYGAGMPSDRLEELLVTLDWNDLLVDQPARKFLSYRRKDDDRRYRFDLQLGFRGGKLVWPSGLRSGQKLGVLLSALTERVADAETFADLPIPFYAVATDVKEAEAVVLSEGSLAQAIRASMAIPGFFTPVVLGDRTLIDGGLTNNVPVDVVRAMGADIVIAIDIGAQLQSDQDQLQSFLQITGQTVGMLTRKNMREQLAKADLVITPPIGPFSTMEFDKAREIIDVGTSEAWKYEEQLAELSIGEEAYRRHREGQIAPQKETIIIDSVEFLGNERVDDRIIEHVMPIQPGDELDLPRLVEDLGTLFGLGDFSSVGFRRRQGDEGDADILIDMTEKPWGPNYVHFGLGLATDLDGDVALDILLNLTATRINSKGAEWRNDLRIGTRRQLYSEFYQPLTYKMNWFVAPRIDLNQDRPGLWEDGDQVATLDVRKFELGLDLGYQFGTLGELRVGLQNAAETVKLDSGTAPPDVVDGTDLDDIDIGGLALVGVIDTLDNVSIPHRGSVAVLDVFTGLESFGSDATYTRLEGGWSGFGSFGKNTIFGGVQAGGVSGGDLPIYEQFALGGFLSLSGYAENELRGDFLGVARLGYYYNISGNWHLGGWLEAGNVWQDSSDFGSDLIGAGTLFLGNDTLFGPLYLAFGYSEEGKSKFYFSIGQPLSRLN